MIEETNVDFTKCFAAQPKETVVTGCAVLTEKLCETRGNCPFFKTEMQFALDASRAEMLNEGKAYDRKTDDR